MCKTKLMDSKQDNPGLQIESAIIWQSAMNKAKLFIEGQQPLVPTTIEGPQIQEPHQECLLKSDNQEVVALRRIVGAITASLKAAQDKILRMSEQSKDKPKELESTRRELEELKVSHLKYKQKLSDQVLKLQSQLETAKDKERVDHKRILELESILKEQEKLLNESKQESKSMTKEKNEMRDQLGKSRHIIRKLQEELLLWKRYCKTADEARKTTERDYDLRDRVFQVFGKIEYYLKKETQDRHEAVDVLNGIGRRIVEEIKNPKYSKIGRLVSVECQTKSLDISDPKKEISDKDNEIKRLQNELIWMDEKQEKLLVDVEHLNQQNNTLRDVIKSMRKERERFEKEKEQIEEEVIIVKLEASMKMLKKRMINERKDLWSALKDVKQVVTKTKMKSSENDLNILTVSKCQPKPQQPT